MGKAEESILSSAALAQIQARVHFADMRRAAAAAAAATLDPTTAATPYPAATRRGGKHARGGGGSARCGAGRSGGASGPRSSSPGGPHHGFPAGSDAAADDDNDDEQFAPPHMGRAVLAAHDAIDACPELRALHAWVDELRRHNGDKPAPTDLDLTNGVALLRALAIIAPAVFKGEDSNDDRSSATGEQKDRSAGERGTGDGGAETELDEDGFVARRNMARLCRALARFQWSDPVTKKPLSAIDFGAVEPWAVGAFVVLAALIGPDADLHFHRIKEATSKYRDLMDDLLTKAVNALKDAAPIRSSDLERTEAFTENKGSGQATVLVSDGKSPTKNMAVGKSPKPILNPVAESPRSGPVAAKSAIAIPDSCALSPFESKSVSSSSEESKPQRMATSRAVIESEMGPMASLPPALPPLMLVPEADLIEQQERMAHESQAQNRYRPEIRTRVEGVNASVAMISSPPSELVDLSSMSISGSNVFHRPPRYELSSIGDNAVAGFAMEQPEASAKDGPRIPGPLEIPPLSALTSEIDVDFLSKSSNFGQGSAPIGSVDGDQTTPRTIASGISKSAVSALSCSANYSLRDDDCEGMEAANATQQRGQDITEIIQRPFRNEQELNPGLKEPKSVDLPSHENFELQNPDCGGTAALTEVHGQRAQRKGKESFNPSLLPPGKCTSQPDADVRAVVGTLGLGPNVQPKFSMLEGSKASSRPKTVEEWAVYASQLESQLGDAQQHNRELVEHAASLQRLAGDLSSRLEAARVQNAKLRLRSSTEETSRSGSSVALKATRHRGGDSKELAPLSHSGMRAELAAKQRENDLLRRKLASSEKAADTLKRELDGMPRDGNRVRAASGQLRPSGVAASPSRRGLPR